MKKKNDGVIEITASIGVALKEGQETDFETLYKSADFALYKAKNKAETDMCSQASRKTASVAIG